MSERQQKVVDTLLGLGIDFDIKFHPPLGSIEESLAYFLIKGQVEKPTLFIFDEPTTGLHFHDVNKLLESFNALIANGHSVIIIEYNMDVIKSADWVIDLGPESGNKGGEIVFEGTPEDLVKCKESYTGKALKSKL